MDIAGFQKITLVDYPGLVAATVFTRGCSFRCPFCHNPELVMPARYSDISFDEGELLDFLSKRFGKLQGICITGGEPTMQKDLLEFIEELKIIGYKVKLDTNGWNPKVLESIINSGKVDYIAMDIKSPPERYQITTSCHSDSSALSEGGGILSKDPSTDARDDKLVKNIKKSISLIMQSGIDYEFRTTVCHPIHEVADFEEIGKLISGAKRYFIQNFVQSKHNNEKTKFTPFTDAELKKSKEIVKSVVEEIGLR